MGLNVTILNVVYSISFICSLYIGASLFKLRKNPFAIIYCFSYCLLCCNVLSGVIFDNDLLNAPKAFCFFQGYMVQFICYITTMSALCFSYETYSLIVNYKRSTIFDSKKAYYFLILIYPLILGIPLFIVCLKTDAIIPRELKCDVARPVWVRMLGYSGGNFLLSLPGSYFIGRSAYVLYRHLDQFEIYLLSSNEDLNSQSSTLSNSQTVQTPTSQKFSPKLTSQTSNSIKRYNMTKGVAIRMLIFCLSFVVINALASLDTIIVVIANQSIPTEVSLFDWVGSITGIYIFLIFGFSREIRNAWKF